MSKEKQTAYKENVRAIAEEMQLSVTPEKLVSAADYMRARIAVRHMADLTRDLLQRLTAWADCEIQDELIKRGLIPDQEGGDHE